MKVLHRSIAAVVLGGAAFLAGPAHATLTCSDVTGMTLTSQPTSGSGSAVNPSACEAISGGYNYAFAQYGNVGLDLTTFISLFPAAWGSGWEFIAEADDRGDSTQVGSFNGMSFLFDIPNVFDKNGPTGSFTVDIHMDDPNVPFVPLHNANQHLELIGIMKPDYIRQPGNTTDGPSSYPDSVFAYLFGRFDINKEGKLDGTFDFDPALDTKWAGLALFGRIVTDDTSGGGNGNGGGVIPEPGVLALLGAVALAAGARRRKATAKA